MKFLFVHALEGFSLAEWYLSHTLEKSGYQCRWRGQEMRPGDLESHERFRRTLAAWEPDVVGFSCHYWSLDTFVEAARWCKILLPRAVTVLGGPQVTSPFYAEHLLSRYEQVDYIVRGEGEATLVPLLEAHASQGAEDRLRSVPNVSYRSERAVRHATRIHSGRPDRGIIFCAENRRLSEHLCRAHVASYQTLRGCVGHCSYCKSAGPTLNLLDTELVERELEYLCGFEIPHICLCDTHFGGDAERAKRILRTLARVNRGSSLKINPDLAHVDDEYMQLAMDANAEVTCVGIQSTNPVALRAVGRQDTRENFKGLETLLKYAPFTPADLIAGLPGDTVDGLAQTFRDVLDLGFRAAKVYRLAAFPGTRIYEGMPRSLGCSNPILAHHGEVLTSRGMQARENRRAAHLVHALSVATALAKTSAALDAGPHILDRLLKLDTGALHALSETLTEKAPEALLHSFGDIVRQLARVLSGERSIPPLIEDLANTLFSRCVSEGNDQLRLTVGQSINLVSQVHILVGDRTGIELKLIERTIRSTQNLPLDPQDIPPATLIIDLREGLERAP